jgi:hypothetical protein
MSDSELVQAYADVMVAFDATENVAKKNRLADHQSEIFREMRSRGRERPLLQELAKHANETVRSWAQSNLEWLDNPPPPPSSTPPHFLAESIWQIDHAPPTSMTHDEIRNQLKGALPKFCDRIMRLALPAIGLWPQRLRADRPSAECRWLQWDGSGRWRTTSLSSSSRRSIAANCMDYQARRCCPRQACFRFSQSTMA